MAGVVDGLPTQRPPRPHAARPPRPSTATASAPAQAGPVRPGQPGGKRVQVFLEHGRRNVGGQAGQQGGREERRGWAGVAAAGPRCRWVMYLYRFPSDFQQFSLRTGVVAPGHVAQ